MGTALATTAPNGAIVREEFGANQIERSADISGSALAARAQAEINARYIVAERRPREIERFRSKLLDECKRLGFADEAEYSRPVGKDGDGKQKVVTGPSIRLLETAIRYFGNVSAEAPIVMESDEFRLVRAVMTDLETNTVWSTDFVVPKRVEKRGYKGAPPAGRTVISQRINSYGDPTYLVDATDDEVAVKQSAMTSKAQRKNGERLLPSDIIDEAVIACRSTVKAGVDKDPAAARRKVIDAFAASNITVDMLQEYIGKKLDLIQPAEIIDLRRLWTAITNGQVTWDAAIAARDPEGSKLEAQRVAADKIAKLNKDAEPKTEQKTEPEPSREEQIAAKQAAALAEIRGKIADVVASIPNGVEVLGGLGYESADVVPADKAQAILAELKAVAPKKSSSLKFGGAK